MKDPNAPKPQPKKGKKGRKAQKPEKPAEITGWDIPNEICRQITLNRSIPEIKGSVFFPINVLLKNHVGTADSLRNDYYRYPALQPITPNIKSRPAITPTNLRLADGVLSWDAVVAEGGQATAYYVVYAFPAGAAVDFNNPAYIVARTTDTSIQATEAGALYCVTQVNKFKQESLPCILR